MNWFFRQPVSIIAIALACVASSASAEPYVMGAIGDSLTKAANARNFGDNPELSWSTGDSEDREVLSHYHRLTDILGVEVTAYNEAISGAHIDLLPRQARRLARYAPNYVTVGIGANDICNWPSNHSQMLTDFELTLREVIGTLVDARGNVKIVLMPVPDIYKAWQAGSGSESCQNIWATLKFCKKMFGADVTQAQREEFHSQWADAITVLGEVAEQYSENVKFSIEIASSPVLLDELSALDCFHPSIEGQNTLATKTWNEGWFPPEE